MRKVFLTTPCLLLLICFGLAHAQQDPGYRGFRNFTLVLSGSDPLLHFDLDLNNPNAMGITIKGIEVELQINNTVIGTILLDDKVHIRKRSDFTLPLTLHTSYAQLSSLVSGNALSAILKDKSLPFSLSGEMTIRKWIFFHKTIAVQFSDTLHPGMIRIE